MTENEKELISIIDDYIQDTDYDGICENGCSCGECDSCIEIADREKRFKKIKNNLIQKKIN